MGNEKTHKAATGKQPLSISWHSAGLLLFIGDIFTLSILYELAHYIRLGTLINLLAIPFVIVATTLVLMLFLFDTYRVEAPVTRSRLPLTAAFASLLTIITSSSLVYFYGPLHFESIFGRGIMPVVLVLFSFWAYWSRYSLSLWSESKQGENKWLFIGSKEKLGYFLDDFKIDNNNIIVLNDENRDSINQSYSGNSSYLSSKLCDLSGATLNTITDVVIATEMPFNEKAVSVLMNLRAMGSFIYDLTTFYEQHLSKVPVLHLKHGWFLNSSGFYLLQNAFGIKLKRLLDILISTFLLLLLLPIMLFVSILIKLDSHGPVFYSQTRTGLNGKNFLLHKFRTMCVDAEKNGAVWANKDDVRITRVGRLLRKSRIDELPQLWNVLKSEMSFIGPRPERPEFIEDLEKQIPFYELRHLIKPGITGWAQVMYPYGASLEDAQEKLEYDLFYIKKYSLLLDFSILMKTLRVILRHQGR